MYDSSSPLSGPDFWGSVTTHGPANVVNLMHVPAFADTLARELAKSEAIRNDPFSHLPAKLLPESWAVIVRRTSKNLRGYYRRALLEQKP